MRHELVVGYIEGLSQTCLDHPIVALLGQLKNSNFDVEDIQISVCTVVHSIPIKKGK